MRWEHELASIMDALEVQVDRPSSAPPVLVTGRAYWNTDRRWLGEINGPVPEVRRIERQAPSRRQDARWALLAGVLALVLARRWLCRA